MSVPPSPTLPQPLAAPPAITAPAQRILIPASSQEGEASMVTPTPSSRNVCGDKAKVGRWTEPEHVVFLEGLQQYGKQWKMIAEMIGTRTVVQVRTHAQKYFQKMERKANGGNRSKAHAAAGRMSRRKSLPASSPSRKKSRKSTTHRSVSMISLPVPPRDMLPTTSSLTSLPSYVSKSSASSSEEWNAVTPVSVASLVDLHNPVDHHAVHSLVEPSDSELSDLLDGEDPLAWLVDVDTQHYLPDSSLPMFPDLNNDQTINTSLVPFLEKKEDMIQDALANNMVDTNVTLQSLLSAPAGTV